MTHIICLLMVLFFLFLKLVIIIAYSLKHLQNVFMQSSPLYTPRLFPMSSNVHFVDIGHWISAGNDFTYFCCRWFFRIICKTICSFNQRFKIFMNNNSWYLLKCLILMKLQYFSAFRRHCYTTKIFFFTYLYEIQVFFVSKLIKAIQTIRIPIMFLIMVIFLTEM